MSEILEYLASGRDWMRIVKLSKAKPYFEKVVDRQPWNFPSLLYLGIIAFEGKKYDDCIEFYNYALGAFPIDSNSFHKAYIHLVLAIAYDKKGNTRNFKRHYSWMTLPHEFESTVPTLRNDCEIHITQEDTKMFYRFGLAFCSQDKWKYQIGNAIMQCKMGTLNFRQGKFKEAYYNYESAIFSEHPNDEPWCGLGELFLWSQKYLTAIKYFHIATILNPENFFPQNRIHTCYAAHSKSISTNLLNEKLAMDEFQKQMMRKYGSDMLQLKPKKRMDFDTSDLKLED